MIRFKDRIDAGNQLAQELIQYKNKPDTIVIGLPRGGVIPAWQIASQLNLPLDIIVPRKIGAPYNPELAVGALTQEGTIVWNTPIMRMLNLTQTDVQDTIDEELKEAQRRLQVYRGNRPSLNLKNKIVILVDDGIATGATIRAAIASIKNQDAKKIIVAVPVAPADTIQQIEKDVDKIICLLTPEHFGGVGAFYESFGQTSDDEVIQIMSHY